MLIRVILFVISIVMIIRTSGNVRGKSNRYWETFMWLGVWAFLGVVAIVPDITTYLANWVGVGRGVDLATYLAIVVIFSLIFKIYIRLEKMERDMTKVVRYVALDQGEKPKENHES